MWGRGAAASGRLRARETLARTRRRPHGRPTSTAKTSLRYAVDEAPPHVLSAFLGFQVVVLIITGIAITPLVVLRAVGLEQQHGSWVVFAAMLISGLATMLQARRIGPVGAGYVLFMGTSGAFIAVGIAAVSAGGLALLGTLVAVSALVQFLFAARLSLLRRILTPAVGGTVIMLIAVTVFPIAFDLLTKTPPGMAAGSEGPTVAGITFLVIIGLSLFARGGLKLWAPLLGVVAGCIVALPFGLFDLSAVAAAPWIGLPDSGWPGLDLSFGPAFWALLPAFLIVTVVGAIETYGDGIAVQRISHRGQRALDFKAVQGADLVVFAVPVMSMEAAARAERERILERRSLWRLRALVAVFAVLGLVASGLAVVTANQRERAEQAVRQTTARELAAESTLALTEDTERSILLALEAVAVSRRAGEQPLPEAVAALHLATQTSRLEHTLDDGHWVTDVSPDGRWLAYESDAGGDQQVYVRPLFGGATVVRVSSAGGRLPRWAPPLAALAILSHPAMVPSVVALLGLGTALALLARLFRYGRISHHGGFVDVASARCAPLPVDPLLWRRVRRRPHPEAGRQTSKRR